MNLGELIVDFRIKAQDTVRPYLWPDKEVAPLFAEAESEASVRAKLINDTDEIPVAIGDTVLDLPSGLFDIQYAELRAADGTAYEIVGASRRELDKFRPGWRTRSERPREYVHDDKTLTLGAVADAEYTLYLDFFRLPAGMSKAEDEPEIHEIHHLNLVDWVLFRAYSKPDADTFNPGKAKEAEAAFVSYFGKRSNADVRRKQNANRPHRNVVHT